MFDPFLMRMIAPPLDRAGQALAARCWSANRITWIGFAIGCGGAIAIAMGAMGWGLAAILLNRVCDGLDGAVARATRRTDFGGYLDIVLDFVFYGLVVAAFAVDDPSRATAAAVLLASFMATASSFLAFAVIAARRGLEHATVRHKSLFFAWGVAEGGETIAFLVIACLWPDAFVPAATIFAAMCWLTAAQRIGAAAAAFK